MSKRGGYKTSELLGGYLYRVVEYSGPPNNRVIKTTDRRFEEDSAALAEEVYSLRVDLNRILKLLLKEVEQK